MIHRVLLSATAFAVVAGSASAADLPARQAPPPYVPPPVFSWTGLYLGAQLGYAWGSDAYSAAVLTPATNFFVNSSYGPSGVVGGAHVGYNLQLGQFVAGVEGDVEGTSYDKTSAGGFTTMTTQIPVQGSIRARLGVAMDRALFYATGGVAFAGFQNTYSSFAGFDTIGKTRAGWTLGGGLEYALNNNWSIRAEYRYTDYGTFSDYPVNAVPFNLGLPATFVQHHETENAIRGGVTYKFGAPAAPVVTTY